MSFCEFWQIYTDLAEKEAKHKDVFEKRWEEKKRLLREVLGGNIYEEKINLHSDPKIVYDLIGQFVSAFSEREQKILYSFFSLINVNELSEGRLNENRLGFSPGTKLGKVLIKYLHDNGVNENIDAISSKFSNLLQKIRSEEVTVRISIDPLDILLASENTTGWKTCHALDCGHRTGNLAYIVDRYTAIAYAYKSYADYRGLQLPRKMWRIFVYIDVENATAYFQRQYPSEIPQLFKHVQRIIEKLLAKYHGAENPQWERIVKPLSYLGIGSPLIYLDGTSVGIRLRGISPEEPRKIFVGDEVPCPICGIGYILHPKNFWCFDCGLTFKGKITCYGCGCIFPKEDAIYYDGQPYCDYCFQRYFTYCWICDRLIPQEDALAGPDGYPYCEECYNRIFAACDFCDEVYDRDDLVEAPNGEYCCRDCFDEYLARCERCGKIVWREDVILIGDRQYCHHCASNLDVFSMCDTQKGSRTIRE